MFYMKSILKKQEMVYIFLLISMRKVVVNISNDYTA